jgi:hypothetical protein
LGHSVFPLPQKATESASILLNIGKMALFIKKVIKSCFTFAEKIRLETAVGLLTD